LLTGTRVLEEINSPINGKIKVVQSVAWGNHIQVGKLTQSGGVMYSVWKKTLKKVMGDKKQLGSCLILGLGGGDAAKIVREYWSDVNITGVEIDPIMSRSRVVVLQQLNPGELRTIIKRGEKYLKVKIDNNTRDFLIESSNGDARVALIVLEIASNLTGGKSITMENIEQALQRRQLEFDKKGEDYYNVISAFIKSMRASNVDAALYYLARMVEAGQDPLYIARRMVVFASEDIGMANPNALLMANEVFRACDTIGYPECAINLAHATVYLSKAEKNRRSYEAYFSAVKDVKTHGNLPVPMNLRNAPTKLMKEIGYGKGYEKYSKEDLLPEKLKGKKYYKN